MVRGWVSVTKDARKAVNPIALVQPTRSLFLNFLFFLFQIVSIFPAQLCLYLVLWVVEIVANLFLLIAKPFRWLAGRRSGKDEWWSS